MKKKIENSSPSILRTVLKRSDKILNLRPVLSTWVLYKVFYEMILYES